MKHIEDRCEDVAVFLQVNDVGGTVKLLASCIDVELGIGTPFNADRLPPKWLSF